MTINKVTDKTLQSNEKLRLARELVKKAESLPEGDDKRQWLEEQAQRLIDEARALTDTAKQEMTKYR